MPKILAQESKSLRGLAIVVAIVAFMVAVWVRLTVASEPLWLDELHTAWVVDSELSETASRAAIGNQGPLYFWIVWLVTLTFGNGDFALRLTSLLAGCGLLLLAAAVVYHWTKSVFAAAILLAITACDGMLIYYATEARPYAVVQLLGAAQVYCFWNCWKVSLRDEAQTGESKNTKALPFVLLALLSAALFSCHYTAASLFLAELVFLVTISFKSLNWRPFGWTAIAVALLCLPAGLNLLDVLARRGNWETVASPARLLRNAQPELVLLAACAVYRLGSIGLGYAKRERSSLFWLIALWALVPIVTVLGIHYSGLAPISLYRYTVVGSIGSAVLASTLIGKTQGNTGKVVVAALLLTIAFSQNDFAKAWFRHASIPMMRFENWREPLAQISNDKQTSKPVFLFAGVIEDVDAAVNLDADFQNYLKFPMAGGPDIDESVHPVIVCSSFGSPRFSPTQLETIRLAGGCYVLVRGSDETVQAYADELSQKLGPMIQRDAIQRFGSPDSNVVLLSVDL